MYWTENAGEPTVHDANVQMRTLGEQMGHKPNNRKTVGGPGAYKLFMDNRNKSDEEWNQMATEFNRQQVAGVEAGSKATADLKYLQAPSHHDTRVGPMLASQRFTSPKSVHLVVAKSVF